MNFDRFIHRPVLSTVISIIIVVLGIIGLIQLPIEQYPNLAPPTVQVSTAYAGADAQTVLNSVIIPLEEQINGVEGMTYMTSTATNSGGASITVYFKEGTDPDMAAVNVQNRVQQAQSLLPADVVRVGVTTQKRQSSMLMVYSLTSKDGRYDAQFLANYADINILPALKRVPGVGSANTFSQDTYAMRLWLDPDKMRAFSLIPSDVSGILSAQNFEAAPGSLGESGNRTYEYSLRYKGRLKSITEYENIILKSDASGNIIRLKDVAKIELGSLSYSSNSLSNGSPAVTGMVSQIAGSNANDIVTAIKAEIKELEKDFPPGMEMTYVLDVTDFLYASIWHVIQTLLEAFLLVFIVVYIFLQDFRSTLIPAIAVPVSLVGTFFFLQIFGFSLNLLTLSALVLAIAIVVDDAIVVVEAVHAKLDEGYDSARTASIDAMHEISGAIISITLVMAAVFVPVSFISGISGTFYREFGVTMAVSIVISAVNALTLSPTLCALFLKPHNKDHEGKKLSFIDRFHVAFNAVYENRILRPYRSGVEFFVRHKVTSGLIVLVSIIVMVLLMKVTSSELVPSEDTGTVMVTVATPPGTSREKTEKLLKEVADVAKAQDGVEQVMSISGFSLMGGAGSNYGSMFVRMKPFSERSNSTTQLAGKLFAYGATIKDASVLAMTPPMVPGYGMASGVSLTMLDKAGGSLDKFFAETQKFLAALNARPEVAYAMTQYNPSFPQYIIDVDVATTMRAGTTPQAVLSTLQGYFGGMYVSNFNSYGKLYRVLLQSPPEQRLDINALNSIFVRTGKGEMAPISSFVTTEKVYGPASVNRFNLYTSIDVMASPAEGYATGDVLQAVSEVASTTLSAGYGYDYAGLTRSEKESSNTTALIFGLCLLFVYLILSAQYESYLLPFSVILSIPFGLAGAFLFGNIFGHTNNIYMQIALIMLIGLLAKNAILIVEFALERRRTGMALTWSAILGAVARLRPILMTSLAMIVGLLPLMFASGVGANGNSTLGASTVGGMLIGMILQIFIVPALFVVFQSLQERFKPLRFDDIITSKPSGEVLQFSNTTKTAPQDEAQA
ncbi:efflux RND transporter permease subunit [uncultured Porphyromonas sp.]|uniref:efflux RND transporter permease subunit n=1 Tax=uncultured Porphyromonas sp. TaxID=159274 RepID=UPI002607EB49|nr:efflux RND transporter permease subunit [uncultured Porphyromonas sp.]